MNTAILFARVSLEDQLKNPNAISDEINKLFSYCAANKLDIIRIGLDVHHANTIYRGPLGDVLSFARSRKGFAGYFVVSSLENLLLNEMEEKEMMRDLNRLKIKFRTIDQPAKKIKQGD